MNDAEFVTAAIPDSMRLSEHPDSKLVCEAITSAVLAFRNSGKMMDKSIARDINAALTKFQDNVMTLHLAEEDEAWNTLKMKAESAPQTIRFHTSEEFMPDVNVYYGENSIKNDPAAPENLALYTRQLPDGWSASLKSTRGEGLSVGNGDSELAAMRNAVEAAGYVPLNMKVREK